MNLLFCDEAGNSGTNYLDPDQPVHVVAGMLVNDREREEVRRLVSRLQGKYQNTAEVKGNRLAKEPRSKGRRLLADFIAELTTHCQPFFLLWEKRFAVAQKAVDTFLDPDHTPEAAWLPWTDFESRRAAAEAILALGDFYLKQFLAVYRQPSTEGFVRCLESFATSLKLSGQDQLSDTLRSGIKAVPEILEAEERHHPGMNRPSLIALNLPALLRFLEVVDRFLEVAGKQKADVVHDETAHFGATFAEMFRLARQGSIHPPGNLRVGFNNLPRLHFGESKSTSELQAADLLASGARLVAHAAIGQTERCPHVTRIEKTLLDATGRRQALRTGDTTGQAIGSKSFYMKLWGNLILEEEASAIR